METALIIIASIIGALIIFRKIMMAKMSNTPKVDDHANILIINEANANTQLKDKIVLVDFWASWCAPCKMIAPILNNVAEELPEGYYVGKINIEEDKSLAQKYKVRNIPTLILFKNGKEVKRFVGIKQKDFLIQNITEIK